MGASSRGKIITPLVRDLGSIAALNWEGKVFNACNPVLGTGVVGQTSLALTLATVYFQNRGAKAMVPLWMRFTQEGTVANGRIEYVVYALDADQFTSGTALEIQCMNRALGGSSQVLGHHTATIPAIAPAGNAVEVTHGELDQTVTDPNAEDASNFLPAPGSVIVKPFGGLAIYTQRETTAPAWLWDIGWAELEV